MRDEIGRYMLGNKMAEIVKECSDKARYCLDYNRDNLVPYLFSREDVALYHALCQELSRIYGTSTVGY